MSKPRKTVTALFMVLLVLAAFIVGERRGRNMAYEDLNAKIRGMDLKKRGVPRPPHIEIKDLPLRFVYMGRTGKAKEFWVYELEEGKP